MLTRKFSNWNHRGTLFAGLNATAETTVDATPRQVAAPTFSKAGEKGLTVDTANNEIVITEAGDYNAGLDASISGATGRTIHLEIYKNTTGTGYAGHRDMASTNVEAVGANGLIPNCIIGDKIRVYQYADVATVLTVHDIQLTVTREG